MTTTANAKPRLLPQEWLRDGATLHDLEWVYGIKSRRGVHYTNLVSLKYSMIDSPLGDLIVQQSRGLILDSDKNWDVVARPFDKFFNLGEPHAATLKWPCQALEKLDGTLCILYFYDGQWRVATSGVPDASGDVGPNGAASQYTFGALFWWLWNVLGYIRPEKRWQNWTFMFELMTPYNRVVCRYDENRIVFLGARGNDVEGEEIAPDEFPYQLYKWKAVKEFKLSTIEQVLATFKYMDPLKQEGYVLVDGEFNRVKVKHPGYVALHHMKGEGFNSKRILEVIRAGEVSEILLNFPEWRPDFMKMQHTYASLIGQLQQEYEMIKDIPVQKDFALEAVKSRCSSALFAVRNKKAATIKEWLDAMNVETLLVILTAK